MNDWYVLRIILLHLSVYCIRAPTLPWLTLQAQHAQGLLWRKTTCGVVVESAWAKNVHGWFMLQNRRSIVILNGSRQKSESHVQLFASLRLEQPDSDEARCLCILVGMNIHRLPNVADHGEHPSRALCPSAFWYVQGLQSKNRMCRLLGTWEW